MSEEAEFIFNELKKDYTLFITREEYSEIAKVSIGTIVRRMNRGVGLPNYKRAGDWKNAKILFVDDDANLSVKLMAEIRNGNELRRVLEGKRRSQRKSGRKNRPFTTR